MKNTNDEERKETSPALDWKLNQTLRNVQGLLKGRSFPGKVLLSRRSQPPQWHSSRNHLSVEQGLSKNDSGHGGLADNFYEENKNAANFATNATPQKSKSNVDSGSKSSELLRSPSGTRATDSARLAKFTKELSGPTVVLDAVRELAWSGVPPYLRPTVWRLLLVPEHPSSLPHEYDRKLSVEKGYEPPNSDRRNGVLMRKRVEYMDCVSQYYDIPDSERSDEEINMLRQIAVDCPRTVPDVAFFQQAEVQKSLERILYTWAIRHPASGYVQGINDLLTPFFVVFLTEHLEGSIDGWKLSDLPMESMSKVEADCYWCLSKLLDGMQDHYTFAQPGIQRLAFKFKELVRRIDEPVSRHMEEQGLEFLQFAFRWFNCLLIREVPFHLVTRLWDTYIAEGDALPDFLVYISASLLLTWSEKLQKLDFQEMVMFLQHLPTLRWTHQELEMVLSRAYMWHTMFEGSPNHLAS